MKKPFFYCHRIIPPNVEKKKVFQEETLDGACQFIEQHLVAVSGTAPHEHWLQFSAIVVTVWCRVI